jgi:hypothetical protein
MEDTHDKDSVMIRTFRNIGLSFALLLALSAFADLSAAPVKPGEKHPVREIELPLMDWIGQGEHTDFPWTVEIAKPALTYEQRMLVKLTAAVRADKLQKESVPRDLHFIVKVADENGAWTKDESYAPFPMTQAVDRHSDVQLEAEMYLQPGKYRIATIVYDSVLKQHNLAFKNLEINHLRKDPLPDLQKDLPKVEYLPVDKDREVFGAEQVALLVATRHRVQIDLIVDVGKFEDEEERAGGHFYLDRFGHPISVRTGAVKDSVYLERLLQSAAVLSAIKPVDGCVSITVLDPLKRKLVFRATPLESLDWESARQKLLIKDGDLMNVADYTGRLEAPKFLQEQVESIVASASVCRPDARVVLLLSSGKYFGDKSAIPRVDTRACAGKCVFFYLHQVGRYERDSDELKTMFSGTNLLEFRNPAQLRQRLADLINVISAL